MEIDKTSLTNHKAKSNLVLLLLATIVVCAGIFLALASVFAMPDGEVRPILSIGFFSMSVLLVLGMLILIWRNTSKEKSNQIEEHSQKEKVRLVSKEGIFDKIHKWLIISFAMFFALDAFFRPVAGCLQQYLQ